MRCRKNVKDLSLEEKKAFIRACEGLKAEPSTLNPGGQNRYDDYVQIHREAMAASDFPPDPGWAHFDSAFFPWHREFLYQFEEELRLIEPGVTIPYWDWTRGQDATSPAFPFTHDFIGVDGTDAQGDRVLKEPGAPSPYPYEFDPEAWDIVVIARDVCEALPCCKGLSDKTCTAFAKVLSDNSAGSPTMEEA